MISSKSLITGVALLSLSVFTASAQTIIYNYGTASATTSPTSDTIDHITAGASSIQNGGTSGTSNQAPSTGYTGASGNYNIFANAPVSGALNITSSTYFTFTLTPEAGYSVSITSLSFGARIADVTATPTNFQIYTSADSYATSIGSGVFTKGSWSLYSPTITTTTAALDTPLVVRIYLLGGQGGTQTGGIRIDDVTIASQAVPEPQTYALIGLGLAALLFFRKRKQTA
jgi:PEP-CTERM motif